MRRRAQVTRREFIVGGMAVSAAAAVRLTAAEVGGASTAAPEKWQIGCYTRPFDKFDYRAAFDAMAEAGYKYAGLLTTNTKGWVMITPETALDEARVMGEEARKRGLKLASAYGNYAGGATVAEGVAELRKLIDCCAASGAPNLMLGGTADEKRYDTYYKAIAESCDYAAAKGLGLSIKPHGGLNATGPQCRKAIDLVGKSNFRLWYDPGNIYYYSDGTLNPVEDAGTVNGLVVGMSVKDYRHPKDVMVTPGKGQVDFPNVFAQLKKGGFAAGPVLVECLAQGDMAAITAEARQARLYLEDVLGQKA